MLVNKYAGRSLNDISQYPIMPWIGPCGSKRLSDFISLGLDVNNDIIYEEDEKMDEGDDTFISQITVNNDDYNEDPNKPRNLKLHTGRLSTEKEKTIVESYHEGVNEFESQIYGNSAFHLKFGFSNSQITLSHLVRCYPHTKMFIEYNGKLDHPDRMVSNYQELWRKVCTVNQ